MLPNTLLACPPNKAFVDKYQVVGSDRKMRESTESQRTDRYLEKGESTRTLARTNSITELNKNNYGQRAASTAALTRGRISSRTDLHKPVQTAPPTQTAPYVWITFF